MPLQRLVGVDQQALLAALHFQGELGDRGVGDDFEGVADAAALDRVDAADQVDVDLGRVQGGDQVGQRVVGGAQVDRALQRFVEQRRGRAGARRRSEALRAFFAGGCAFGELHPGADRLDVGLFEELGVRQGDLG